jgi:hypothetical protein
MVTTIDFTQLLSRRYFYWEEILMADGHISMVETECTDDIHTVINIAQGTYVPDGRRGWS